MEKIIINTPFIKLDQLLKFANITSSGGEAKLLIQDGFVCVNDKKVTARGKKIVQSDKVKIEYDGTKIELVVE